MSACGPFVPLSPSGDFLPLGCSLTLWSGREAGGLLVLGSGPQWECGCWAGLPHWRKEELSVGPGNSDLASTYFLHLLTMARLLQALPLLLLTRRKLPCFLALSPRVLRGSGTSCRPRGSCRLCWELSSPCFCVPETRVPGTHRPAPGGDIHMRRCPPSHLHLQHLVSLVEFRGLALPHPSDILSSSSEKYCMCGPILGWALCGAIESSQEPHEVGICSILELKKCAQGIKVTSPKCQLGFNPVS